VPEDNRTMKKLGYIWKVWANALGVKTEEKDNIFSDDVAITRTVLVAILVIL